VAAFEEETLPYGATCVRCQPFCMVDLVAVHVSAEA
jgi:hypothetical protein